MLVKQNSSRDGKRAHLQQITDLQIGKRRMGCSAEQAKSI